MVFLPKGSTGTVLREFTFHVEFLKTVPGHPLVLSSFSARICSPFATGSPRTVLNKFPLFGNFSKLSLGTFRRFVPGNNGSESTSTTPIHHTPAWELFRRFVPGNKGGGVGVQTLPQRPTA